MATAQEILKWAARGGDIPTEVELHNWLADLTAGDMNETVLSHIKVEYEGADHLWLPFRLGNTVSDEDLRRNPPANGDFPPDEDTKPAIELYRCLKDGESNLGGKGPIHEMLFPVQIAFWVQTGLPEGRDILRVAPRGPIEEVHEYWQTWPKPPPMHPLIPLIKAWQEWKGRQVQPDRRRLGLLPVSMRDAQQAELFGNLPQDLDYLTPLGQLQNDQAQGVLPGLESPTRSVIPPLCIGVYTVNGGVLKASQGAPIAERLLFEVLMAVERYDRLRTRRPDIPLREVVRWIWPNGWQRGRDLPRLQKGLWELDNMRVHLHRALWRLVALDRLPALDASLDDFVPFNVKHLPESDHGPLIHRHILRQFGVQSAPAWRSFLRLAYIWDEIKARNGGRRVYATRPAVKRGADGVLLDAQGKPILKAGGAPLKDWSDPRAIRLYDGQGNPILERNPAADRITALNLDELARLGFDERTDKSNRKRRAQLTRVALTKMEKQGAIVLERDNGGWRILEPAPSIDDLPNRLPLPT